MEWVIASNKFIVELLRSSKKKDLAVSLREQVIECSPYQSQILSSFAYMKNVFNFVIYNIYHDSSLWYGSYNLSYNCVMKRTSSLFSISISVEINSLEELINFPNIRGFVKSRFHLKPIVLILASLQPAGINAQPKFCSNSYAES